MRKTRFTRSQRRILLALLSGASNLSGYPISKAAQVRPGALYPFLWRLEGARWVLAGQVEDGRRFYRLTVRGRKYAMQALGLEELSRGPAMDALIVDEPFGGEVRNA